LLAQEGTGAIGASEAAEKAGVSLAGARRALDRMAETGFVRHVGGGHSRRYALRDDDPVTDAIRNLFRDESQRYLLLRARIRQVVEQMPEIKAAWTEQWPVRAGVPLTIGVLTDARSSTYLGEQLRSRVAELERDFDLIVEFGLFTPADLPATLSDEYDLLAGYLDTGHRTTDKRHSERDARTAKLSREIAEMIDRDPSLVQRASRYLDFLLAEDQGAAAHDIREWKDILANYSRQRLKEFLASDSPRAQRLRQSSPFFAALSPDQRNQLLAEEDGESDS
jgi:hypothetical protein